MEILHNIGKGSTPVSSVDKLLNQVYYPTGMNWIKPGFRSLKDLQILDLKRHTHDENLSGCLTSVAIVSSSLPSAAEYQRAIIGGHLHHLLKP